MDQLPLDPRLFFSMPPQPYEGGIEHPQERYTLTFEPRGGYLFASVRAPRIDREIALGYLREAVDECRRLGFDRLLIYREIPETLPPITAFGVGEAFGRMSKGIRTAFVVELHPRIHEELEFKTLVARNRGSLTLAFTTIEAAEGWLLGAGQ